MTEVPGSGVTTRYRGPRQWRHPRRARTDKSGEPVQGQIAHPRYLAVDCDLQLRDPLFSRTRVASGCCGLRCPLLGCLGSRRKRKAGLAEQTRTVPIGTAERRPRADAAGTPSSAQSRVGGTHSVRHSSQWKDGEGGKERVGETWN